MPVPSEGIGKVSALLVSLAMPLCGAYFGILSMQLSFRVWLICFIPLILIFKPTFIRRYFGDSTDPDVLGWLAFAIIFIQYFIFPFWLI